jgi:hypothetical protein
MFTRTVSLAAACAALLTLTGTLGGCKGKPKAGDTCQQGQGACADGTAMLACVKGVLALMPCHGALGCTTQGNNAQCDNSLAAAGDVCDEDGDFACSQDKKAALACRENKFALEETCKGARACTLKTDGLYCDNDLSDPGDPCHTTGDYACTTDKKLALKCGVDHKMAALNTCKGAKACRVFEKPEEKKVEFVCDDSVADVGDPCDEAGEKACSVDLKSILECKANKFVPLSPCAGGCSYEEAAERFECRGGAAAAGADAKKGNRA